MTRREFANAWQANDDGGGLAYVTDDAIVWNKPFWAEEEFWEAYQDALSEATGAIMLHFRFSTSGRLDSDNTHPHPVETSDGHTVLVAHNGILPGGDADRSDTRQWVDTVFWGRPLTQLYSRQFSRRLRHYTSGNKIIMLAETGRYRIINGHLGVWRGPSWFSNSGAFSCPRPIIRGFNTVDDLADDEYRWYLREVTGDTDDDDAPSRWSIDELTDDDKEYLCVVAGRDDDDD